MNMPWELFYLFLCFEFLSASEAAESFRCPPATSIIPCTCRIHTKNVRCDDVSSLDQVRSILEAEFSGRPLPRLYIRGVNTLSLPPRTLGNLYPTVLVISDSNLRSIDDSAFVGQEESLNLLSLANDRLQDIPAGTLRNLINLETLSLTGNFFMTVRKGTLDHLENLQFLALSDNRISTIDKDAFPKQLKILSLSNNLLHTFNGSLHHLQHLVDLWAADNRLTRIWNEFDGLTNLETLHLDRNYLSDIDGAFVGLDSLTRLSLSGNRIREVGKTLSTLVRLRNLDLSGNYITDLHWRTFEKLKGLEYLDVSGNYLKVVCPTLRPLRSLNELNLSGLNLKTLEPDCFRNMKSLATLDLSHNRLASAEVVFRNPLPSLHRLRLDHNRLTFVPGMRYAKSLRYLDIGFNNFRTLGNPHLLAHNRELKELRMGNNPWECTESVLTMLKDVEERGIQVQGHPEC